MKRRSLLLAAILSMLTLAEQAHASIIFTFSEVGGTVTMTPSGTLDTTKLVAIAKTGGWNNTGTEDTVPGAVDIMGGTEVGSDLNAQFAFHDGTDASAITNPGGPFAFSSINNLHITGVTITGEKAFATYSGYKGGLHQPGIMVSSSDIIGGLWTPDQHWIYAPGTTFASLGLIPGTYTVADSVTGESITIQITPASAVVPEPSSLALFGMATATFAGYFGWRRRKQPATT